MPRSTVDIQLLRYCRPGGARSGDEGLIQERQRLWVEMSRGPAHWDGWTVDKAERVIEITKLLNGHSDDITGVPPEFSYQEPYIDMLDAPGRMLGSYGG